jgi:hypothetical protein
MIAGTILAACLSRWISDLHFTVSLMFYIGLAVVSASLLKQMVASASEDVSARQPNQ